jgi:magnesium transporter
MIRYLTQEEEEKELIDTGELASAKWVNIYPPFEHGELERFADNVGIPLDFLTDSLDIDERSRYEREEDAFLILINTPVINDDPKEAEAIYTTVPIGIILSDNRIITISSRENPTMEKFLNNRIKGFNVDYRQRFILQIFEQNVYIYLAFLKKLNLKRNLIEQELYNSSRNKELQQLLRIEKSLVYFVNSLSANDLLKLKMKRIDLLKIREEEELQDLFEDIIIDNGQALEMSNVYTNILSGTMETYASIVSNNMNVFIHRLTIITIILMVPTLVASFYGMNLKNLPMDDHPYAFYYILVFSLILGLFLIWFFRRNKQL